MTYTYKNEFPDLVPSSINLVTKIPDNTTWVSGGTFDPATKEVTVPYGELRFGQTATYTVTVQAPTNPAITILSANNAFFKGTNADSPKPLDWGLFNLR